ncbi:O-acetyl-ADP-ribose deacetylase MACROD1 isoform X2 [Lingula anatina]|uniref:O-acetyl-ADP-ribose deacetylase MACROD1 isoform X2 n=1 Tax=Lingula anatina TaxID=7574 RepID=A0A1S3JLI6_LINAN|nr:O-acetyl-ADP-ribose deacetylase MACROD1 isoform X2 [Lingula anatina]|eukprot:XP_013410774.1 O-acetyl-ADP-ribose deacetylase MACROD1 isoform X2 [Lingula anatina]
MLEETKETYLTMPLEEKRKVYKCGRDYITPDKIQNWPLYVQNRRGKYKNKGADKVQPKFEVNQTLNQKIALFRGDITKLEIDAIVNAANSSLAGGGGVDGSIHSAAGQRLLQTECKTLGGCKTGEAKITGGYKLPAKYVIHTVGPVGENEDRLKSCYVSCLNLMKEYKLRTVAFPCISTGIYGYPNEPACDTALSCVRNWLEEGDNADTVDLIIFCLFLPVDVGFYESKMLDYFPLPSDFYGGDGDNGNNTSTKDDKSKSVEKTAAAGSSTTQAKDTSVDVAMESQPEEALEETSNTQPMASLDMEDDNMLTSHSSELDSKEGNGNDVEIEQEGLHSTREEVASGVKIDTELKDSLPNKENLDHEDGIQDEAQDRM